MKRFALALAATLVAGTAIAASPEDMVKSNGCLACHAIDHKVVGPAYKDVAKKYAGQKDAEAKLVAKVKAGGSGNWGQIPMPAQGHIKEADIKAMVSYILSLK